MRGPRVQPSFRLALSVALVGLATLAVLAVGSIWLVLKSASRYT